MKIIAKSYEWECIDAGDQWILTKGGMPVKFVSKSESPNYAIALVAKWDYLEVNLDVDVEALLKGAKMRLEEIDAKA